MCFPHHYHLFNGDIFSLRQEEVDEHGHHKHPEGEEQEESEFQVAQQH